MPFSHSAAGGLRSARTGAVTLLSMVLLLVCAAPLHAQDLPAAETGEHPARAELNGFARDMESLEAEFEQRVIRTDGEVEDSSTGRVWLLRPHQFRWEYGGDFPEVVVADGERVWIHDVVLEQVTVKPQSELAADSPLTLLTDLGRLEDQFEVREAGEVDGMFLLELRARNPEAQFDRVLLGMRGGELRLMALEDAFGLRTELNFRGIRRNAPLDPGLFRFQPPDGVDLIGDAGVEIRPLPQR